MKMNQKINIQNSEIMVVDDTQENLTLLSSILLNAGYRVRTADSGELALASIEYWQPDLFLMDVKMPGMDGFEVCKNLKANPKTAAIPIIFITALNETEDKVLGFQCGGADFITKPYEEEEVLSRVASHIELHLLYRELEQANSRLQMERELLETTLYSIGDGVICTDESGKITMMNPIAQSLTGWYGNSAMGEAFLTVFNIINESSRKLDFDPVAKVIETGKIVGLANHTILISKEGIERAIADSAAPIRDDKGIVSGVVVVFRDVTDEKGYLTEIEYLSFHDQLTGLYNRRFLEEELLRMDTPRLLPLTLVMGDLNGLKMTNDAFGHFAGDGLLKNTAQVLRQCFRQDDIICRYGGDEFVAVLPNTTSKTASDIIKRIQETILECQPEKGILSVSFGWDSKETEQQYLTDVLKQAEDNMYKKKMMDSPSVRSATINTIVNTLYEKNPREEAHSKRVSELSMNLAQNLDFSDALVDKVRTAGLLHDIGKIIVPDAVLEKQGKLDESEWIEIKKHPEIGSRILCSSPEMAELSEMVLQHHERWDGAGYPNGLKGNAIDPCARIIAIADAYDAMTCARPYRDFLTSKEAIDEILRNAGTQFDPAFAKTFVSFCKE